jgi:4'-phosphopantetheinyl transferase
VTTIPGTVVPRRLDLRTAVVPDVPAAAGADGTEVWVIGLAGPHGMDEAFVTSVLSEEEAARAAAFHFPQDRVSYEASHVGLRLLLGARLGCPPDAVPLAREDCLGCGGPHGRPVLADGALHFSLSHTRTLSLIALARRRVGVDLEAVPEPATAEAVTPRLHPTERAELAALPEDLTEVLSRLG